ncbi:MAG: NAD(P)-dependent oxidoreductase [Cyanobacteria bacterium]|nr:NAD(P)-dependent oxidoreductase [Cyanobacteriota bacterium]
MENSLPIIGFVGVGRMGANMAQRLVDVGYSIGAIYDINTQIANQVAELTHSKSVKTLAEVSEACDIIFTVVTDDQAMRDIYTAPQDNLLKNMQAPPPSHSSAMKPKLFINCATISPQVHQEVYDLCESIPNVEVLEVPMASSIPQAREGKLFLMCAGKEAVFKQAEPLLKKMSASLIYTGPSGTAASVKALVNMVMNINTAALAEGLGLADALGLDLKMVCSIFAQTGANSRVLETDADDMILRDHSVYFSAAHAAKDSRIAYEMGKSQGLPMVLAGAVKSQYETMEALGLGELDKSGISELTFKQRMPLVLNK